MIKQCRKYRRGIESGKTHEVNRTVHAYERYGAQVADNSVIFDWPINFHEAGNSHHDCHKRISFEVFAGSNVANEVVGPQGEGDKPHHAEEL